MKTIIPRISQYWLFEVIDKIPAEHRHSHMTVAGYIYDALKERFAPAIRALEDVEADLDEQTYGDYARADHDPPEDMEFAVNLSVKTHRKLGDVMGWMYELRPTTPPEAIASGPSHAEMKENNK